MNLLIYLLQTNFYLILFFAFYKLILEKETYFTFNRVYLIIALLLSPGIPLIEFGWLKSNFMNLNLAIDLPALKIRNEAVISNNMSIETVMVYIYLAGVFVSAVLLIRKLVNLKKNIINPVSGSAFSFFHVKFVDKDLTGYQVIHVHEDTHIKEMHSLDILLFEFACVVAWFNPVVYFYKTSISTVHEFIADRAAAEYLGDKKEYAFLLLNKIFKTNTYPLVNSFFKRSLIKKRIFMLQKERSGKASILKYGLLLPSFLCFIFLSSASISSMGPSQGNATFKAPEFPGGLPKFKEFLSASLKYSDEGLKNNISGRVILSFVVDKSGYITNIEVIKSLGYGLDEAAVSALEDSPKWQPGMENGRPVNTRYDMPVLFQRRK